MGWPWLGAGPSSWALRGSVAGPTQGQGHHGQAAQQCRPNRGVCGGGQGAAACPTRVGVGSGVVARVRWRPMCEGQGRFSKPGRGRGWLHRHRHEVMRGAACHECTAGRARRSTSSAQGSTAAPSQHLPQHSHTEPYSIAPSTVPCSVLWPSPEPCAWHRPDAPASGDAAPAPSSSASSSAPCCSAPAAPSVVSPPVTDGWDALHYAATCSVLPRVS